MLASSLVRDDVDFVDFPNTSTDRVEILHAVL